MRFQLLDSEVCCLHGRRCQRLEKDVAHSLIDGKTAHVETFSAMPPVELLTPTIVAGRRVRALVSNTQPTAAGPTDGQALQQCGSFSQGVTCLVESSGDVRLEARLNGFKGCPVDETFMMFGKKYRPLFLGQMTNSFSDSAVLIDVSLVAGLTINVRPSIHRVAEHAIDGGVTRSDPTQLMASSQGRHHA